MDIRKVSIGPDYKSGAMHYIVGQSIFKRRLSYTPYTLGARRNKKFWIERDAEIILWKSFTSTMPISIEYNINF